MKKIFSSCLIFLMPFGLLIAQNKTASFLNKNFSRGTELRMLRLAISATGEYTQSVKGANDAEKAEEVLRQIKESMFAINEIYGREFCVRLELLPD